MKKERIVSVRRPGQPGTKKYLAQHGDRLRCLRYIYDLKHGRRLITIELIVEEGPWSPDPATSELHPDDLVGVFIDYIEYDLREQVMQLGARWDPHDKLWFLKFKHVKQLGLADRKLIVKEEEGIYLA